MIKRQKLQSTVKNYNLIDLISDLIANLTRLESFDSHLYKFLKASNFSKGFIGNKCILNQLREYSQTSKDIFELFLQITSLPSGDDDLKVIKRGPLNIIASPISVNKGSGYSTPRLRSKWHKF